MHTAFCERNNMRCPICDKMIQKVGCAIHHLSPSSPHQCLLVHPSLTRVRFTHQGGMANHWHCDLCSDGESYVGNTPAAKAKHLALFHTPWACACGETLEMVPMMQHKHTRCPLRRMRCRFCHNIRQAGPLSSDSADRLRGYTEHEVGLSRSCLLQSCNLPRQTLTACLLPPTCCPCSRTAAAAPTPAPSAASASACATSSCTCSYTR